MKKSFVFGWFISMLLITGCGPKSQPVDSIDLSKYEELENEYEELEGKYEEANEVLDQMKTDALAIEVQIKEKDAELLEKEEELKTKEEELLENEAEIQSEVDKIKTDLFRTAFEGSAEEVILSQIFLQENPSAIINPYQNIFNPLNLKPGENVNGFVVKEVKIEDTFERVSFDGSFILTGEIAISHEYGGCSLFCNKQTILRSMPVSLLELGLLKDPDKNGRLYWVVNQEDLDDAMIEKGMPKLDEGIDVSYKITAIFKDYTYDAQYQSEFYSGITFVELLAIEEVSLN